MSVPTPSERPSYDTGEVVPGGPRLRSGQTVAYAVATVLGGLGALVVAAVELTSGDAGTLDVVLWSALAVLLFSAAAGRWWFGGHTLKRSRLVAADLGPAQVADAERASAGEIDTVRRLRVAHPGLGLRDAYELVKRHGADGRRPR